MNKIVTASEANRNFSRLLSDIRNGHEVTITSHGEIVARLIPAKDDLAAREASFRDLLERLRSQPTMDIGPWTREELYDGEEK